MNYKTEGRTYAFKFLYQTVFSEEVPSLEQWEEKLSEFDISSQTKEDEEGPIGSKGVSFGKDILKKVFKELPSFMDAIPPFLKTGNIKTLSKVEKAIVFLGYYELKFELETPFKVILNEYINLAKTFGQERSAELINGILENMATKFERKNK